MAVPAICRHGWRDDRLCASLANTFVLHHGEQMPVCRMHEATYTRWGDAAEEKAVELWEWPAAVVA